MSDERLDQQQDDAFALLAHDLPRVAPPGGLLDRVLAEAAAPPARPLPRPRTRRAWLRPRVALALGGALAVAVLALVLALATTGNGGRDARVAVTSADGAVHGTLEVVAADAPAAHVVVRLQGLPPAPAGHHYTAWILAAGSDQMTPIGSFTATGATTELDLPLPGPAAYVAFDVSLQDDAAPPEHSGVSVAGARLG